MPWIEKHIAAATVVAVLLLIALLSALERYKSLPLVVLSPADGSCVVVRYSEDACENWPLTGKYRYRYGWK